MCSPCRFGLCFAACLFDSKGLKCSTRSWAPTDEVDGFLEVRADVSRVAVLHRDPLVAVLVLEGLGAFPGDVEQGRDVQVGEKLALGGVVGTTKVEKRQDFHRAALEEKEQRHMSDTSLPQVF